MQAASVELVQITDTHLFADPAERLLGVKTYESARAVLADAMKAAKPDLLLITGDIAQQAEVETYQRFRALLDEYWQGPVFTIPGNHDLSAPMAEARLAIERVDLGAWSVIGVDTHTDGEVGGNLTDAEFDRLSDELAGSDAPHVLLAGHHPPIAIGTPWLDRQRIANGDRLVTWMRLQPRVEAYLFGHVHQRVERREEDLQILGTPSTCFQFEPGSQTFSLDRRLPGYRTLTLTPAGEIETRVHRLRDYDLGIDHAQVEY